MPMYARLSFTNKDFIYLFYLSILSIYVLTHIRLHYITEAKSASRHKTLPDKGKVENE
jgi:hypothetical protein